MSIPDRPRHLWLRVRRPTCPACGKDRYATQEAAQAALRRYQATSHHDRLPVRVYRCTRGWWHLTSSTDPMDTTEAS